jgi:hypothetical protein
MDNGIPSMVQSEIDALSPGVHGVCYDLSSSEPNDAWGVNYNLYTNENIPHSSTNSSPVPMSNGIAHDIDQPIHLSFVPMGSSTNGQSTRFYAVPNGYYRSAPITTLNNMPRHMNNSSNASTNFNQMPFTGTRTQRHGDGDNGGSGMTGSDTPSLQEYISSYIRGDVKTHFASYEEAMKKRRKGNNPQVDRTIPIDDIEKRAIVSALCKAMQSTAHAEDNDNMIAPFRNSKIGLERMEFACWRILVSALSYKLRYHISHPQ